LNCTADKMLGREVAAWNAQLRSFGAAYSAHFWRTCCLKTPPNSTPARR
jgi:hypothetical protein